MNGINEAAPAVVGRGRTSGDAPGAAGTITVLLVDDHAIVREGVRTLVDAQPDMKVLAEASDGQSAVEFALATQPLVVVMDVSLPRLAGAAATTEICRACPRTRVLALSMHEDRAYLRELLEAGAAGYVLKRSAADDLIRAIRVVAVGGIYLDPSLAGKVVGGFVGKPTLRGDFAGNALSDREAEVLRLIAQGYSNKEVAAQLSLSVKTIETYKARSMEKLCLNSRVDIIRFARGQGWLDEL